MKSLSFLLVGMLCFTMHTQAEIRNVHQIRLQQTWYAIERLQQILQDPSLSKAEVQRANKRLKALVSGIKPLQRCADRVEEFILKLKNEFPALYHELNEIRDAKCNITHIYIEVDFSLTKDTGGIYGITNVNQSATDPHVYYSKFGNHTVSVTVDGNKSAFRYLLHELGHVRYQVPNLASYVDFYHQHYNPYQAEKGHAFNDPSHQAVLNTLKEYYFSKKAIRQQSKAEILQADASSF